MKVFQLLKLQMQQALDVTIPIILELVVKSRFYFFREKNKRHALDKKLIISLTSYPARFGTLDLTIKCLLMQSVMPDSIVLWISYRHKNELPRRVINLQRFGLEIRFCEDIRSYKKIIPSLVAFPNSYIVTADDDLFYPKKWLQELVCELRMDTKEIVAHRVHRIQLGYNNKPMPYNEWILGISDSKASKLNFPTSGAGVLYPPDVFHKDVCREDIFLALCPNADDVWLYWMAALNGASQRRVSSRQHRLYCWVNTQSTALSCENVIRAGNDRQFSSMIERYGMDSIL